MQKWWIELTTGELGYLWSETRPLFASFVTITVERPDGTIYKTRGQVYRVENPL